MTNTDHPAPSILDTLDPAAGPLPDHGHAHGPVCNDCVSKLFGFEPVTIYLSHVDCGAYGDVEALVVGDDESTRPLPFRLLWSSLAAACADVTGQYLRQGFTPAGGWSVEYADEDGNDHEVRRRFVPAS